MSMAIPQGTRVALLDKPPVPKKNETAPKTEGGDGGFQVFGSDGFTFRDFIDIINPLQHIPLVSTFYRDITGDTIDPGSRVLGGALFGGPIGAVASALNVAVKETTGMDMGEHAIALFEGNPSESIDTKLANSNPLANYKAASGLPGKSAFEIATGAETAILNAERAKTFGETNSKITGAEIELLKAESARAVNMAQARSMGIVAETGAETAVLKAEANASPVGWSRLAGPSSSPILGEINVREWAQNEALMAAKRRTGQDMASPATTTASSWFTAANYRRSAELAYAPTPNIRAKVHRD